MGNVGGELDVPERVLPRGMVEDRKVVTSVVRCCA
jgi:hypothetical protein